MNLKRWPWLRRYFMFLGASILALALSFSAIWVVGVSVWAAGIDASSGADVIIWGIMCIVYFTVLFVYLRTNEKDLRLVRIFSVAIFNAATATALVWITRENADEYVYVLIIATNLVGFTLLCIPSRRDYITGILILAVCGLSICGIFTGKYIADTKEKAGNYTRMTADEIAEESRLRDAEYKRDEYERALNKHMKAASNHSWYYFDNTDDSGKKLYFTKQDSGKIIRSDMYLPDDPMLRPQLIQFTYTRNSQIKNEECFDVMSMVEEDASAACQLTDLSFKGFPVYRINTSTTEDITYRYFLTDGKTIIVFAVDSDELDVARNRITYLKKLDRSVAEKFFPLEQP